VFTRPDGLTDAAVVDVLELHWRLAVDTINHAPVGFGSFHWNVSSGDERWFVTVDDLVGRRRDDAESTADAGHRLGAALATARALADAGLPFVVAPTPSRAGAVIEPVDDRYVVAVYRYVHGRAHPWSPYPDRSARLAVLELLAELHAVPGPDVGPTLVDDRLIPRRAALASVLADHAEPWAAGPFGEPARALVHAHATEVAAALEHFDRLSASVVAADRPLVLTHGEPHRGNTIDTAGGVVLIDWDTALLAPPERDLWALADEDVAVLDAYAARTGVTPDAQAVELYRLWWRLTEIALYVHDLRRPHTDTADSRTCLDGLRRYIEPSGPGS
jgi:spectinomycin phosphotransferase/16S rRNA (guanine(1405)-N(7))-methyltransferase